MSSISVTTWVVPVATALMGVLGGRWWARVRAARRRRQRTERMSSLRAEIEKQEQRAARLEAELHAQRSRSFELERELEARESDWAQSSPAPFAFDAATYQVDRSGHHHVAPRATEAPRAGKAGRDSDPITIEGLTRRIDGVRAHGVAAGAEPPSAAARSTASVEDLKLIDGIDARAEAALNAAGYRSFRDIANATSEELTWALAAAGPSFANARTQAWRRQAEVLAGRGIELIKPEADGTGRGRASPRPQRPR